MIRSSNIAAALISRLVGRQKNAGQIRLKPRQARAGFESLEGRMMLAADGVESMVNVTVSDIQKLGENPHAVAWSANGNYAVTWETATSTGPGHAFVRVFAADGSPVTGEIRVDSITAPQTAPAPTSSPPGFHPAIAIDQAGNFVVAFKANGAADSNGIYARRFSASGNPLESEFLVNLSASNTQEDPAIAMAPDGRFVISWSNDIVTKNGRQGSSLQQDIYAQRFSASGVKAGSQFLVHAKSSLPEFKSTVAMDSAGNFAVGWEHQDISTSPPAGGYGHLLLQRYSSTGVKLGTPLEVAPYAMHLDLAYDGQGRLISTWKERIDSTTGMPGLNVMVRVIDVNGQFSGSSLRVNDDYTPSSASGAEVVSADQAGNFIVAWENLIDGDTNIQARRYLADGLPDSEGIFQVNTTTVQLQRHPSVAVAPNGLAAVVVWDGFGDADDSGVFRQQYAFASTAPVAMTSTLQTSGLEPTQSIQKSSATSPLELESDKSTAQYQSPAAAQLVGQVKDAASAMLALELATDHHFSNSDPATDWLMALADDVWESLSAKLSQ